MGVKLKELGLKESPLLEKKKVYGELKKIDIDSDVPYLQSQ
jgi:predicted RNA-binding protein